MLSFRVFSWSPFPFLRIVLFLIAGILSGIFLPEVISIDLAYAILVVLVVSFVFIAYRRADGKWKVVNPGIVGLTIVACIGYIQVHHRTESNQPQHIINCKGTVKQYSVTLVTQPQEKENSWKAEGEVEMIQLTGGKWELSSGKVLLYFSKKDYKELLRYGDKLLLKGQPILITGPANPGEFDFKKFSTYRNIYHQHFLHSDSILLVGYKPINIAIEYSIRARAWADRIIKQYVQGEREQATTSALVLGLMDGLDNELIGAYAATGSLHVLSVSGLHVGIIYWLMLLILKPLEKTTRGKWTLAIVSVLVLWAYAFITGLSPSVLRAVTMFSFVAVAKPWNQRTNIYNTLAVSAFCLLVYDPYLIMSVGFQLSYLAVIGIVYLQPLLLQFWEPKRWLGIQVWQVLCVSVAAQLATVAIGLFYFHQFPVYFLLANLFVIPASFFVLIVGILLIAVGYFSFLASPVGIVVTWFVKLLNGGVVLMERLPFSLIENVNITTLQCWILMLMLVSLILMLQHRSSSAGVVASICMMIFSVIHWQNFLNENREPRLAVYKVNGHTAFDCIEQGETYFFADSALIAKPSKIKFHIHPNRIVNGVKKVVPNETRFVKDVVGGRIIAWRGKTILHIQEKDFRIPPGLIPEYIIVSNNSININVLSDFKSSVLILDSSNSVYFADKILTAVRKTSVRVYSVHHQGAFIAKLSTNETGRVSR